MRTLGALSILAIGGGAFALIVLHERSKSAAAALPPIPAGPTPQQQQEITASLQKTLEALKPKS